MMELLERYLAAVAAELPADQQQDIIRELRANLLDQIDALQQDGPLEEAKLSQLLLQQGHPIDVAQRFAPSAPLVASEDMPLYKTVLWHGAALMAVIALLKGLNGLMLADSINPVRLVLQLGFSFIDNFATLLLVVTAVFYLSGHAGWTKEWRQRQWHPSRLPRYPLARMKLSDSITDLTSALFLLLLLWTPLWLSPEAQQHLPVRLADGMEYWRYLLTVFAALSAVFACYRLTQLSWQRWSKWCYILDHLVFAVIFATMALQGGVFTEPQQFTDGTRFFWTHAAGSISYILLATAAVLVLLAIAEYRQLRRL
jgi:hypothetical protein